MSENDNILVFLIQVCAERPSDLHFVEKLVVIMVIWFTLITFLPFLIIGKIIGVENID